MLKILVVNRSKSISTERAEKVVKAVDRQLREDLYPAWNIRASIKLCKRKIDVEKKTDGAVIFLDDKPDPQYSGYHEFMESTALPVGFVFRDISEKVEDWSVTLSHEAIELIGNRHCGLYCKGPHPTQKNVIVDHWFEFCDAVQDQVYSIDRVSVSDFLYPCYWTTRNEESGINNHLRSKELSSFGLTAGGYIGYVTRSGQEKTYFADKRAMKRFDVKEKTGDLRRHSRNKVA